MRPSIRISDSNLKIGNTPSSAFKPYIKPVKVTNEIEIKTHKKFCIIS